MAAAAASRLFSASSALRLASRSSSSFSLATVSTGLALPKGFDLGLAASELTEVELGARCSVRLLRCSLVDRSSWVDTSDPRGPPESASLGA